MVRNFSGLFRCLAIHPMGAALAAVVATTSAGIAAPMQAALVESVTGHTGAVEVMDYLDAGQTIRLGVHDTIVLSYLHSCVRETITGGTVTIGTEQSEVQAGKVTRTKADCGERTFVLTSGGSDVQFAGRVFRGLKPQASEVLAGGPDEDRIRK
jgi:hypothetical protein